MAFIDKDVGFGLEEFRFRCTCGHRRPKPLDVEDEAAQIAEEHWARAHAVTYEGQPPESSPSPTSSTRVGRREKVCQGRCGLLRPARLFPTEQAVCVDCLDP